MEAKASARCATGIVALILIGLPGCAGFMPAKTDPTPTPKADAEVPQVVKDDTAKPKPEAELDAVQQWAAHMNQKDTPLTRSHARAAGAPAATAKADAGPPEAIPAPPAEHSIQPAALTGPTPNLGVSEERSSTPTVAPTLRAVEIRAAGAPESLSTHRGPRAEGRNPVVGSTAANAPASSHDEEVAIQELLRRWLSQPGGDSFQEQLDRRVLSVLNDEFEAARSPLEAVSAEQQRVATQFIETLITLREAHGGDMAAAVARVLPHVDEMRESLAPLADLTAPVFVLCRTVRGFGQYEALTSTTLATGRANEFVTYLQISNFASRRSDDGQFESQFSLRTQVLSKAGETVLEYKDEAVIDRCRTRRQDCFIPRLIQLPATLGPGEYVVKVTIADKIGQKVTEARTTFKLAVRT